MNEKFGVMLAYIAGKYNIRDKWELMADRKWKDESHLEARRVAMYVVSNMTNWERTTVDRMFGFKHRSRTPIWKNNGESPVYNSCVAVAIKMSEDEEYTKKIKGFEDGIRQVFKLLRMDC